MASTSFQSLDEIVRATGRSWRTVRKRLEEANCYPLPLDIDRGDILVLFDDGPEPTYTAAERAEQMVRWESLRDRLLSEERDSTSRQLKGKAA